MSSAGLPTTAHPELFLWDDTLDASRYLMATYVVSSTHDGEATAIGIAMEQSASTVSIAGYVEPAQMRDATIRVRHVEALGDDPLPPEVPGYALGTEVYAAPVRGLARWRIEFAVPLSILRGKPAQLLNVVVGEIPRLGFIARYLLESCRLPPGFGPGPSFGVSGIRERFGAPRGPLLCRSMRPATGLDVPTMQRLHHDVLVGGFHLVKDDELQCFDDDDFETHVRAMLDARDRARDATGEPKGYLVNLICEPWELPRRWALVCSLGVDAAMVAPMLQGFGSLAMLARDRAMPLFAHNTGGEALTRHPSWGITPALFSQWQQDFGADWWVTEGGFGDDGAQHALVGRGEGPHAGMPVLQGGKNPAGLPAYRRAVGDDDYMLIVASWVDGHPEGLRAAAQVFRDAVDASVR